MRAFLQLLAAALALAAPLSALAQQQPAADIMNVSGQVTITRAGAPSPATAGGQILTGDVLATGKDGSAGLSFSDGSRIAVGADSVFRVDDYRFEPINKGYGMAVMLQKGVAAVTTGKMAKFAPESMQFSTPLATMGIRGTRFLVKAQ